MIIGFIGFGQVASTLSNILSANGIQTVTVVKDRSQKTNKLAVNSDVQIIDSYKALLEGSDIVISANSPANALNLAEKYSDHMGQGIYHLGATEGWGFDTWQNPEEINNQLKFNCNFDNIEGTIFFTYKDLVPGKNEIKNQGLQKLKEIWNNK